MCGGIEAFIGAMTNHPASAAVAEQACSALCNVAFSNEVNNAQVHALKGVEAVLSAMRLHASHVGVQEQGCSALCVLGFVRHGVLEESLAKQGVQSIVQAMQSHPSLARLAEQGCSALRLLSSQHVLRPTIDSSGAADAVVLAMRNHPLVEGGQEDGWAFLRKVAPEKERPPPEARDAAPSGEAEPLAPNASIEAVVDSMRASPQSAAVAERGCAALRNLAANNDVNSVRIAQYGGVLAVIAAMRSMPEHAKLLEQACGALRNLAFNDANQVSIAANGGIAVVTNAMRDHPNFPGVQEEGCGALRNLAFNDSNSVAIASSGGIVAVVKAMRAYVRVPGVRERLLPFHATLVSTSRGSRLRSDGPLHSATVAVSPLAAVPVTHAPVCSAASPSHLWGSEAGGWQRCCCASLSLSDIYSWPCACAPTVLGGGGGLWCAVEPRCDRN